MKNIPFSPPDITQAEIDSVVETLKSGWLTTGPKTKLFEEKIASYCGNNKAVALNSATACMEMTLRMLGIGPGDEVITSAYTYTASASVIEHIGAKIVLVDCEKDSYNIDYEAIGAAITEKTKAIIPVDIAGVMCDYRRIRNIVESKKNLFVANNKIQKAFSRVIILADGAHSFGAKKYGEISGSVADFTAFSFHAVKNLTTGEGGAVTWRDIEGISNEEIYKEYMLLSLHGQSKDALAKTKLGSWEYDIVAPNFKCNMTDIMAAIGLIQLERYESLLAKRKDVIQKYTAALFSDKIECISHFDEVNQSSGHLFLTRINNLGEKERNTLIMKMAEAGIATNVHYKPLPMHTAYKSMGFDIENYPNAYNQYKNEITLPLHTLLDDQDINYIIENYKELVNKENN